MPERKTQVPVEYAWQDMATKTIWYDGMASGLNQYSAELHCSNKPDQALATRDDFTIAEAHGIRELIKMDDKFF